MRRIEQANWRATAAAFKVGDVAAFKEAYLAAIHALDEIGGAERSGRLPSYCQDYAKGLARLDQQRDEAARWFLRGREIAVESLPADRQAEMRKNFDKAILPAWWPEAGEPIVPADLPKK